MLSDKLIKIEGERFIVNLMYAHSQNMMQCNVYKEIGFGNQALAHPKLWELLQKLIPLLKSRGQKLKIFDAYRPPVGHQRMLEIIPMKGFFAQKYEHSLHCHATAIDCCLTDENGIELIYPTKVDAYTPGYAAQIIQGQGEDFQQHLVKATHHYQASEMAQEIANREDFRTLMESVGFEALEHEWWHYNLPNGIDYPVVDFSPD